MPPFKTRRSDPPPPPAFTSSSSSSPSTSRSPPPFSSESPSSAVVPPPPAPLVAPSDLVSHLHLLRTFHLLEHRIRSTSTGLLAALSPDERWGAYLRLGALRLEVWVEWISPLSRDPGEARLSWDDKTASVPEDAAVCWYAWALTAGRGRYEEDCLRRAWDGMSRTTGSGGGRVGRDFPVEVLVRRLADPALLEKGKALWSSALSAATRKKPSLAVLTAWDATNILAVPTGVEVECPWEGCGVKQAIPLLTGNKGGYAQPSLSHRCSSPACHKLITRPVLGLKKLFDVDLASQLVVPRRPRDEEEAERRRREKVERGERGRKREVEGLLAATLPLTTDPSLPHLCPLYTPHSSPPPLSGRALTSAVQIRVEVEKALAPFLQARKGGRGVPAEGLNRLEEVERVVDEGTGLPKRVITHLLTAYSAHSQPSLLFSTDIALSALRLGEFVAQIAALGWLDEGWAEGEEAGAVLREVEGRYERFLAVAPKIAGKEGAPLFPPLDVDFVWHTHLLMASQYRRDVVERFGSFVTHHDAVEETLAAAQWDKGRKLYEDKYGLPLCTLPCYSSSTSSGTSTLSSKTAGKIKRFFRTSSSFSSSLSSSTLVTPAPPPPSYDSFSLDPEATAPSTHSSILVHRAKQDLRRRKRKEGEVPFFLRSPEEKEALGVWVVEEEEARRGSGIVGVDSYSPPSAWSIPFTHPSSFDPGVAMYSSSCEEDEREGVRDLMGGNLGRWAGTRV